MRASKRAFQSMSLAAKALLRIRVAWRLLSAMGTTFVNAAEYCGVPVSSNPHFIHFCYSISSFCTLVVVYCLPLYRCNSAPGQQHRLCTDARARLECLESSNIKAVSSHGGT